MPAPRLIGRLSPGTPADLAATPGSDRPLPDDILRDASRRLAIVSLLGAILWIGGTLLYHVAFRAMTGGDPRWKQFWTTDWMAIGLALVSLLLYGYARRSRRHPQFVLDLGLGYMLLTAMAFGVITHWEPIPPDYPRTPMISWIGVVILMFPAIVPSTPGKTFAAGMIAASMNPFGSLVARFRGLPDTTTLEHMALVHYPDFLLVGVAVVISHVVIRFGRQMVRAQEMGSYQLGELLGVGGMGEVYRATHRMLARPAAIKLIRPEMLGGGDPEGARVAVQRFRREAEAAAALRSPHTVQLYDFGVTADDTLYLVMELLDGMDLETLVRERGPLPANRVVQILTQVCESLEEAHARGLVHRDIKPANIHLGKVGLRHDVVKVLDFGLVKSVVDGGDGHSLATANGLTPGTPAYMAPEMALDETVGPRADLYALGCVAHFLLTGRLVFEAPNGLQMMVKHMQETPPPPSRRAPQPVPEALDRLVLRCLAKSPEERPAGAAELARELEAVDLEPWTEEAARRWWELNPAIDPARPTPESV